MAKKPRGPRIDVDVTTEIIEDSLSIGGRAHSSHCMIAEAIKKAFPMATRVAVDISTCRFSDPKKGHRYVFLTPRVAQDALVDFDEGKRPQPFRFQLRGAHVTRVVARGKQPPGATGKEGQETAPPSTDDGLSKTTLGSRGGGGGNVPRRVGGRRPPQLHLRREYGVRAFRGASINRLIVEQARPAGTTEVDVTE